MIIANLFYSTGSQVIYDKIPWVDQYSIIDTFWIQHIMATEKGFAISSLDCSVLNRDEFIIRLYKLPSFSAEILLEIHKTNTFNGLIWYKPRTGTIWTDRLRKSYDNNGKEVAGEFVNAEKYSPKIIIKPDTLSNDSIYNSFLEKFISSHVDTICSIKRKKKYNTGMISIMLVGTTYIVDCLFGSKRNIFQFRAQKYDDERYNWIISNFNQLESYQEKANVAKLNL